MKKYLVLSLLFSHSLFSTGVKGRTKVFLNKLDDRGVFTTLNKKKSIITAKNPSVVVISEKPSPEKQPKREKDKILEQRRKEERDAKRNTKLPEIFNVNEFPPLGALPANKK